AGRPSTPLPRLSPSPGGPSTPTPSRGQQTSPPRLPPREPTPAAAPATNGTPSTRSSSRSSPGSRPTEKERPEMTRLFEEVRGDRAEAVPVRRVTITVNGERRTADVEPRLLLAHFLRQGLRLTGTHTGCDTTNCGACTVLFDGAAVKS